MSGRLAGKVALISAGARGMGTAHARRFVAEGACVVIGDIRRVEGVQVAAELGEYCTYVDLDVTEQDEWQAAAEAAERCHGPRVGACQQRRYRRLGARRRLPARACRRILDADLVGCLAGIQASVRSMRRSGGGSIVNISWIAGMQGVPSMVGYVSAKWALARTDEDRRGGPRGEREPGERGAPRPDRHADRRQRAGVSTHAARGAGSDRIGEPDEVSAMVTFLTSDEASFCTGAEFVVDGGHIQVLPAAAFAHLPVSAAASA